MTTAHMNHTNNTGIHRSFQVYMALGNQGATNTGQMIHIATIIPLTWAVVMTNVVLAQARPN